MPPAFWAKATPLPAIAVSSTPAATAARNLRIILCSLFDGYSPSSSALFVEPDVFEAPAVVDAVDHNGQPFHPGLPAGAAAGIENDGPDGVLRQPPFDLPDQFRALRRIGLHGLPVDQLIELGI